MKATWTLWQSFLSKAVEATFRTFDADGTGHLTAKQLQVVRVRPVLLGEPNVWPNEGVYTTIDVDAEIDN